MSGEFTPFQPELPKEPVPQAPAETPVEQKPEASARPEMPAPVEATKPVEQAAAALEGPEGDAVAKAVTDDGQVSRDAMSEAVGQKLDAGIGTALADKGIAPSDQPFKAGELGSNPAQMGGELAAVRERAEATIGEKVREQERAHFDQKSAAETLAGETAREESQAIDDRQITEAFQEAAKRDEQAMAEAARLADRTASEDAEADARIRDRLRADVQAEAQAKAGGDYQKLADIDNVAKDDARMDEFLASMHRQETVELSTSPHYELPVPKHTDAPLDPLVAVGLTTGLAAQRLSSKFKKD